MPSAHITSLAAVRAARAPAAAVVAQADRYVAFAEEAMAIVFDVEDPTTRRAVCRITEAWLALAESTLQR